ncbi:MAG: hypothetical protein KDD37_04640, partial [Bdellovibrionales bacterium]|nr:hypothetical protein [Bdellovibrionales bacterium]
TNIVKSLEIKNLEEFMKNGIKKCAKKVEVVIEQKRAWAEQLKYHQVNIATAGAEDICIEYSKNMNSIVLKVARDSMYQQAYRHLRLNCKFLLDVDNVRLRSCMAGNMSKIADQSYGDWLESPDVKDYISAKDIARTYIDDNVHKVIRSIVPIPFGYKGKKEPILE